MKIEMYVVGSVMTNVYFLINEKTNEIVIIDPGDNGPQLAAIIDEKGYKPVAILLTHGHFDHIMAMEELSKKYDIKIYAHELERAVLAQPNFNLGGRQFDADVFFRDGDILELAGFAIKVIHTPGHTPGGVCFYIEKENVLFSGDTLFLRSVGRTDFMGASQSDLVRSIKEKLFVLPERTVVYPGHESETSIGIEKHENPFV